MRKFGIRWRSFSQFACLYSRAPSMLGVSRESIHGLFSKNSMISITARTLWALSFASFSIGSPASAAVTIDWVSVGDPGNACDPLTAACFGAAPNVYRISRFEITNAQYAEFLNAVAATDPEALYNTGMGASILRSGTSGSFVYTVASGRGNKAVSRVSFLDAARFANWLHNGQPTGAEDTTTTEDGAYTLPSSNFTFFSRNTGAMIFIPTEDEWYKAAYYDPTTSSYFTSPLSTNLNPLCAPPGPGANMANCSNLGGGDVTDVGAYTGSPSPFGTFDQGGNVAEWLETLTTSAQRGKRGGDLADFAIRLFSNSRFSVTPTTELFSLGFRVATGPAPGATAQEFFSVDPAQSFIEIDATSVATLEFMGVVMAVDMPLESQVGAGGIATTSNGLRASLTGHILVDIPIGGGAATLEIVDRRSSVRLVDSGIWLPGLPGSPAIPAPGGLAANVESVAYMLSISAAIRNAEFSLGHGGLPEFLTDLGAGLFSFPIGYDMTLPVEPVDGVLDIEGMPAILGMMTSGWTSLNLALSDAPTLASMQGTLLEQPGGGRQITIPLGASLVLTDDTFAMGLPLSISLDLTGQIVATNATFVPEPSAVLGCLAALGTLAALRLRRS